jgi:FkbM family methyltransferase
MAENSPVLLYYGEDLDVCSAGMSLTNSSIWSASIHPSTPTQLQRPVFRFTAERRRDQSLDHEGDVLVGWLKSLLRDTWVEPLARRWLGRTKVNLDQLGDQNSRYDEQTVEVMRRTLRADSGCVDIGAHKGKLLQHMVALAPDGIHHAFEALPHLANWLKERFPGVCVHQLAVSDRSGQSEFQYVENAPAYSGLRRRIYDRPDPRITTIQVETKTLDDVIPVGEAVALVKLDIEGGEYHALRGAMNTIQRWRPVIVFEAGRKSTGQYGVTPDELYSLITETFGYELSTMSRWLGGAAAYTRGEFRLNWESGPDYYFIATTRKATGQLRMLGEEDGHEVRMGISLYDRSATAPAGHGFLTEHLPSRSSIRPVLSSRLVRTSSRTTTRYRRTTLSSVGQSSH